MHPLRKLPFGIRYGAYCRYVFRTPSFSIWIKALTTEEAQSWMEEHARPEMWEAEFGKAPEAGDPEARITLRIPETLRKRIAAIAEDRKQSVNAWIQRCLERSAEEAETGK